MSRTCGVRQLISVLAVVSALLGASATAVAGGDENVPAPPSAGPPGPWSDVEVGEGEDVPYRPTDAKSCRVGGTRDAGPGTVLGVCAVPEKLAKGAARLAGADTVLARGRFTRPGAWRQDEDGRRIATFRASRIVVTD